MSVCLDSEFSIVIIYLCHLELWFLLLRKILPLSFLGHYMYIHLLYFLPDKTVALWGHILSIHLESWGTQNTLKAVPISQVWKLRPRTVQGYIQGREVENGDQCWLNIRPNPAPCWLFAYGSSNLVLSPTLSPPWEDRVSCLYFIDTGTTASSCLASNPVLLISMSSPSCWFHHGSCWLPNPQYVSLR